jgi:hypothetical protein
MKVVLVLLPRDTETNFSSENVTPPFRVFLFGRTSQIVAACTVTAFALLLVATTWVSAVAFAARQNGRSEQPAKNPPRHAPAQVVEGIAAAHNTSRTESSRVLPHSGSQPIKRGDTVVVHQNGASAVRKVAAASNESVVLKRGNAVQGLYIVGKNSYVVVSENEGKVVRGDQIFATVAEPRQR